MIFALYKKKNYICKSINSPIKMKDYSDFKDSFNEWWYSITLIVCLVSFILLIVFPIIGNDDGQIISAIICGISFGLHCSSPLDSGDKPLSRWP
jgi:hypothetical protein